MSAKWDDWIPGVLSSDQLVELCAQGEIENVRNPRAQTDYSSIDLTLSDHAFVLTQGSVKPREKEFVRKLVESGLAEPATSDEGWYRLERQKTYLFELREVIPRLLGTGDFYGQATAKSSVGRLDVLVPLIVEGMDCYESFDPNVCPEPTGKLYVELTPLTFEVEVAKGTPVTQLRLFKGNPDASVVDTPELFKSVFFPAEKDNWLSADLSKARIGTRDSGCAFQAKTSDQHPSSAIKLRWGDRLRNKPDPHQYWQLLPKERSDKGGTSRLRIDENAFYILRSKEKVALPAGIAAYCRPIDETIGEMRIHYAGFVHPFFGRDRKDKHIGTPLIFEVRGHDFGVSLEDGEQMARLVFYRMSRDCKLRKKEKRKPPKDQGYSMQTLALSKVFGPW